MPSFTITTNDIKKATKSSSKKHHHKASKTKVPSVRDDESKVKAELKELEEKRGKIGGGWKGFIQKAALNKKINDKGLYLKNRENLRNIESNTAALKKRIELEKARNELSELRKKREVDFGGFFGSGGNKNVTLKDLGL